MIDIGETIAKRIKNGGKIIICGNGGLAAESEHFAAELMGKYGDEIYLPCISLTSNTSLITALANDFGFENIFSHQIKTLGKSWDLLIAMTTSKSANILNAISAGLEMGMETICLCGNKCCVASNITIQFSGNDSGDIQNAIITYLHKVAKDAKAYLLKPEQP